MSIWDSYPADYRKVEVVSLARPLRAGDCASLLGLSGSGKSNLAGFLVHRASVPGDSAYADLPQVLLIDCNRLRAQDLPALFGELQRQMIIGAGKLPGHSFLARAVDPSSAQASLEWLIETVEHLYPDVPIVLFLDRFDALFGNKMDPVLFSNLRSLRDHFKYRLSYLVCSRRMVPPDNELAELFYSHTVWLGPLSVSDAFWSVRAYASRHQLKWSLEEVESILQLSGRYPSFLRAICEVYEVGVPLEIEAVLKAGPVQARLKEFWADHPDEMDLLNSGLDRLPLLKTHQPGKTPGDIRLTVKEQLLFDYLRNHAGQVCDKDDLIRAVWSEDKVFIIGIRDDSLAQLVRRLREKIETNPSSPDRLVTAAGRGYQYIPDM